MKWFVGSCVASYLAGSWLGYHTATHPDWLKAAIAAHARRSPRRPSTTHHFER